MEGNQVLGNQGGNQVTLFQHFFPAILAARNLLTNIAPYDTVVEEHIKCCMMKLVWESLGSITELQQVLIQLRDCTAFTLLCNLIVKGRCMFFNIAIMN